MSEGIVRIHGKDYKTVALRVQEFYDTFPKRDYGIVTEIVDVNDVQVVMRAAIIRTSDGVIMATGHAEEVRSKSQINRTSALENAETSAIGRALSAFGFGGSEFASANEVQGAIQKQATPIAPEKSAAIAALLESGEIEAWHLERAFGHSNVDELLDVEADRILNGLRKKSKTRKKEQDNA